MKLELDVEGIISDYTETKSAQIVSRKYGVSTNHVVEVKLH